MMSFSDFFGRQREGWFRHLRYPDVWCRHTICSGLYKMVFSGRIVIGAVTWRKLTKSLETLRIFIEFFWMKWMLWCVGGSSDRACTDYKGL